MIESPDKEQLLLLQLAELTKKDPDIIFDRVKQFFHLSEKSFSNIYQYSGFIKKGYCPILYSNHQSHADGVILSIVIDYVLQDVSSHFLKGFFCPIAASIAHGGQDNRVQGVSDIFLPVFERKGLFMLQVIRKDDREKYGMVGSNRESIEKLLHAPHENYGLAIFPEGRVQGGRVDKDGKIHGIQSADEGLSLVIKCLTFWHGQGKESVLLPVGIIDSYKLFSPDSYHISESLVAMLSGKEEIKPIAEIAVGKPFTSLDMQGDLGSLPDPRNAKHIFYIMHKVAELLPKEARGYYG